MFEFVFIKFSYIYINVVACCHICLNKKFTNILRIFSEESLTVCMRSLIPSRLLIAKARPDLNIILIQPVEWGNQITINDLFLIYPNPIGIDDRFAELGTDSWKCLKSLYLPFEFVNWAVSISW